LACDNNIDESKKDEETRLIIFEYERGSEAVREEWTENHAKIVYLLSRFGRAALSPDENETWLRQV